MRTRQRDNSDPTGKIEIRRAALAAAPKPALVLDCYAGRGYMFEAVWRRADDYLGLEKRFARGRDDPHGYTWKGDNRDLIGQAIRRRPWNVVDLDAYGSPWAMFKYVVENADAPRLVVTATCGLGRALLGSTSAPNWLREIAGCRGLTGTGLLRRWYDDFMRWTFAYCLRRSEYRIVRARRAIARTNKDTFYWLLELERPTAGGEPGRTAS
jgi:hypothetical protein